MVLFCLNDYALRHYINLKVSINQDVMMQDAPSFFSSFARLSAVFSCYFHKLYLWFKRALQINQLIKIMQIIIVNLANGHLSQKWHGRRISFAIIADHYNTWWQLNTLIVCTNLPIFWCITNTKFISKNLFFWWVIRFTITPPLIIIYGYKISISTV